MADEKQTQPHFSYPYLSRRDAALRLKFELIDFFDDFIKYHLCLTERRFRSLELQLGDPLPPFRRQIKAPAGLGKTRAVAENLERIRGKTIWFMVPNHTLAKEAAKTIEKLSGAEVHLVKGRTEDNCERYDLARYIGGRGMNVQTSICQKGEGECPAFSMCGYQEQRKLFNDLEGLKSDDPPRVFVMPHSYLTSHSFVPKPDLVIIDESAWQSFIDVTGRQGNDDLSFKDFIEAQDSELEDHKSYVAVVERMLACGREFPECYLKPLAHMFGVGRAPKGRFKAILSSLEAIDLKEFEAAIKHINNVIKKAETLNVSPAMRDASIRGAAKLWRVPILRKIRTALEIIHYELKAQKTWSAVTFDLSCAKPIRVHSLKPNMIERTTPVLLIDASASYAINSKIWGRNLQHVEIRAERNAHIVQVKDRTFSKSSLGISYKPSNDWQPDDRALTFRQEAIEFINRIAEETEGDLFFAASKGIVAELRPHLAENVLSSHYGALRGMNSFEKCNVAVIIGREEPPAKAVLAISRALLSNHRDVVFTSDTYMRSHRNIRLIDGGLERVFFSRHTDDFVQEVLQQIRECEVEQAIDRMRLMHNTELKTVYILTSVALDVTVNKLVKWEDLIRNTKMDKAAIRAFECGKALPLGATDLSRLYGDIWPTRDAAKSYLSRCEKANGKKWVISLIRYYMPNDPLILVEYRRKGQRGKASQAIVCCGADDPVAAQNELEKVVGKVTEVKVLGTILEGASDD